MYWTITPTVILWLFENHSGIDLLTYLDADLYFYSSPDPIFEELNSHSILIHEHRFSHEQAFLEKYGKYNVGLLCFQNDANGIGALTWWRERCIEWCYARLENGKYGDQLYLNNWPTLFKKVVVVKNIGVGVGPWNHIQYRFSFDPNSNNLLVNGVPVVFYHFHALTFVEPGLVIPSRYVTNPQRLDILRLCFLPYINALCKIIEKIRTLLPDFTFGLTNKGVLNDKHTFLAKRDINLILKHQGIPQCMIPLDGEWNCYCSSKLTDFSIHVDRINNLVNANRVEEAFSALSQALNEFPDSPDLLVIRAELENQAVNREKALETLFCIIKRCPNHYTALNDIGAIYWEAGETEHGMKYMKKAFSINSYDRDVVLNLHNMLISKAEYSNAESVLADYLQAHKDDSEMSLLLKNMRDLNGIGRVE